MKDGIPGTESEADSLRAYIPTATLQEIAAIRDIEIAESEKRRRVFDEATVNIAAIKERMRRDRIELKALLKKQRDYFNTSLFARTDAARDAAWIAASEARRAALARGEPLRLETAKECGERQKTEAKNYTP